MREMSPWEGTQDELNGFTALGRVTQVNAQTRRCRVKTLGKKGKTDDMDLPNVQWLNLASHGDGDEDTFLPRINQYGVIIFINSEPYILGWYQPINPTGSDERPDKEPLRSGDRIMKTVAGNSIILRSGGTVELKSTDLCRTMWIPSRNLMSTVLQEWELEVDGGRFFWTKDRSSGNTTCLVQAFNNIKPTQVASIEMGTTSSGALLQVDVGQGSGTGVSSPGFSLKVNADGTTDIDSKAKIAVKTAAGLSLEGSGGAKLKLENGKVALGSAAAELLEQVAAMAAAAQQIIVPTVLGPSGPPVNAAVFAAIEAKITSIMGTL